MAKMKNVTVKVSVAVMLCVLLAGCPFMEPPPQRLPNLVFDHVAFGKSRAAWEAQGIASYSFDTSEFSSSFGPGPVFRVTVTDGEVAGLEVIDDGRWDEEGREEMMADFTDSAWKRGTISDIFDGIANDYWTALASLDTLRENEFFWMHVNFNSEFHFPETCQA